jgi:thiol-disulfide isomerase/thioredoxin
MKRLFTNILLFIVLSVSLSSFTGCEKNATTQKDPVDETNSTVPEDKTENEKKKFKYPPLPEAIATADIEGLDGETFKLGDKKGKVVLVNLWATWCVPCIAEMPHLVELQEKYKGEGLEIIGLNVGDGEAAPETKEQIEAFAQKQNLNYELAHADRKLFGEFIRLSGMAGIPQTVLINREGKMTGIFTGGGSKVVSKMKDTVEKTINE